MQGLIAVGLGGADIVLEPAQDGLVEIVHHTQDVVAVSHGVHNHPEGEQVEDLVEGLVLAEHLAVDGVGVLDPAVDDMGDAQLIQPFIDLGLGPGHEGVVLLLSGVQIGDDLLVAHGVQVL